MVCGLRRFCGDGTILLSKSVGCVSHGGTSGALLWIIYAFGWITSLFSGAIQPNFLCSQRLLNVSLSFTGSCVIVNLRCLPYEG